MLRCFDCNNSAEDARTLVDAGSWTGTTGANSSQQDTVITEQRSMLNSEYRLKFRDFTDDGSAVVGPRASDPGPATAGVARSRTWYTNLIELRRKAVSYKVRGWGRETAASHLVHLYDQAEDPNRQPERKIISALYLETLQPGFTREGRGRAASDTVDGRSRAAAVSAGADSRQPPGADKRRPPGAKASLRLHITERKSRPGSAQPVGARGAADAVDKGRGRSPSRPRAALSLCQQPGTVSPAGPGPPKVSRRPQDGAPAGSAKARAASADSNGSRAGLRPVGAGPAADTAPPKDGSRADAVAADAKSVAEEAVVATQMPAAGSPQEAALAALVKSPPEPTRVKSPEDVAALHSPEPVNWTLPLDTARAFTVTQNVAAGL
ncbi:uncharacterized protein LOC119111452 [Pollicipes pollicipes]|uniref:uncharacterized protein LOC119111452 n=1 Tax=Pollicipes pollicipes TaxID=41117 RepID=UPI00188515EC|nr:uncharacterized protein LOC119111452 [Pollicipes pollicipes]